MKRIIIGIAAVALVGLGVWTHQNNEPAKQSDKPTVRIGTSIPLTGNLSKIGGALKDSLLMAKDEIPSDSKYDYHLFIEDDSYEMSKIAVNTNKLINVNDVDVIFSLYDGASKVMAPIVEKKKVIQINCGWGGDDYKKWKYSFHHSPTSESQSQALTKLLKEKGIKRASLISINYTIIGEVMDYLKKDLANEGIEIVSTDLVNWGTKDFRIILMKMKQKDPEMVIVILGTPEVDLFAKQAMELGLNKPFTSIDMILESHNLALYEGAEFVLAPVGNKDFIEKFKKYSDYEIETCMANFYDMMKIITKIYEKFDTKPTADQVVEELHKIKDYDSAVGVKITVNEDGIMDSDLIRAKVIDGKIKDIRE